MPLPVTDHFPRSKLLDKKTNTMKDVRLWSNRITSYAERVSFQGPKPGYTGICKDKRREFEFFEELFGEAGRFIVTQNNRYAARMKRNKQRQDNPVESASEEDELDSEAGLYSTMEVDADSSESDAESSHSEASQSSSHQSALLLFSDTEGEEPLPPALVSQAMPPTDVASPPPIHVSPAKSPTDVASPPPVHVSPAKSPTEVASPPPVHVSPAKSPTDVAKSPW